MTKKQRDRRLAAVEEQLSDVAEDDGPEWSVEWREAEPAERPEGVSVDAESRTIHFDLWKAQRETLDALRRSDGDVTATLGGYAAGKSILGARFIIKQALDNPDSRFLVLGVSYSEARTATYRVLFSQLPGENTTLLTSDYNGVENSPIVQDYNRSIHKITLINSTEIILGSADKWSRHAGDEYGAIWADEPSHYSVSLHDLLSMMSSRLRGEDGIQGQLWTLTGNGFNDAYDILEKRETADGDELGHDIEVIKADTRENPYLSDGEIESFERQYGGTDREKQALSGGFSAQQGLVYDGFNRDTHVVEPDEARELVDESNEWRLYAFDQGWNDPLAMVEVGKTAAGQLIVLSEFYMSERHTEDAIGWLDGKPKGTIYCEHEPAAIRKFRQANWPAVKAEKSIDAGISELRRRLEKDDSGRPGLLVSSACQHTIEEFLGYKQEEVGKASATDHILDGLRYLVMGEEKQSAAEEQSSDRGIRTFGGDAARGRGLGGLF